MTQLQLKSISLSTDASREKASKRLKKACQSRWLSFSESIKAVHQDYPALVQSLTALKDNDAAALGLLTKINNFKFLGVVYILSDVLPQLAILSKSFQRGKIDFAQVQPSIDCAKDKLDEIVENDVPQKRLAIDLEEGGKLNLLGVTNVVGSSSNFEEMSRTASKHVGALKYNIDRRLKKINPFQLQHRFFIH